MTIKEEAISKAVDAFDQSQDLTEQISVVLVRIQWGEPIPQEEQNKVRELIRVIRKNIGEAMTING